MDILATYAAYSDSDDELTSPRSGSGRRRRSSHSRSNEPQQEQASTSQAAARDEDDDSLQQAPAAVADMSRSSSTWISPEPGEREPDEMDDDSLLHEPPPPGRRQIYSPSPAGALSSTANTPVKPGRPAMQTTSSVMSLVNYGGADDDGDVPDEDVGAASSPDDKAAASEQRAADGTAAAAALVTAAVTMTKAETETELLKAAFDITADPLSVGLFIGRRLDDAAANTPQSQTGSESPQTGNNTPAREDALLEAHHVAIPPAPATPCSQELIEKFHGYFRQKAAGMDFNRAVQNRKDFRNPSIYEKLIEHFDIDETATNFAKEVFNPYEYKPTDYYERLAEAQKLAMDRYNKDASAVPKGTDLTDNKRRDRKSKWGDAAGGGDEKKAKM